MVRKRMLKPDSRGYFRPYIGYKCDPEGKPTKAQPRFNLGKDESQASYRYAVIQKLYDENCTVNGDGCWSPLALSYAQEVARGDAKVEVPVFESMIADHGDQPDILATEYVQLLRVQQDWFPSLNLIPADPVLYYRGVAINQGIEQNRIKHLYSELKNNGVVRSEKEPPESLVVGTLHESLDTYIQQIETTGLKHDNGELKQSQNKRIEHSENFKEYFPDCPLHDFDYDKIAECIAFLTNRPMTKRNGRMKHNSVRHRIAEFDRFMRWLDVTKKFDWLKPRGVDQISRKIIDLQEDRKSSLLLKDVYTPRQLAVIYKYANDFDRMLLLVSLNCAFGAAEIGRLVENEVLLNHNHEYAERLDFETSDEDSFIRLMRPKTGVFGEWLIWPETVDILRWGINRAKKEGGSFIVCRSGGSQLYNETSKNAQAGFAKRWDELLKRVTKEHRNFPLLPFGTLRDTVPDKLRHMGEDTLASMCIAHGTPFKGDSLLDCYGNRPYGRLHDRLRELRDFYSPVFE